MSSFDLAWTRFAASATLWLLTYALHSTLLLGGAWLATRRLGVRRLAVQEVIWKLALIGGLATATLQLGLGVRPFGGAWALDLGAGAPLPSHSSSVGGAETAAVGRDALRVAVDGGAIARAHRDAASDVTITAAAPNPEMARGRTVGVLRLLGAFVLAGGLLALLPLALAHLRLACRLRGRAGIDDGPLPRFLRGLERAAGLTRPARLTATPRLATPIARGLARGEICLPVRALCELAPGQQEGVVAHELAHLARRDPAWLLIARAIESMLFIQPLNRLARRRLVEIAEYRCDDWAAGRTGRPLDLARCLTEVAGWSLPGAAPLPVLGIDAGSALGRRVRRLLERPAAPPERTPRWLAPAGVAALALVALAAPGVTRGAPPQEPAPVEEQLDQQLDALDDDLDSQLDDLSAQLAELGDQMADLQAERGAADDPDFASFGPDLEREIEALAAEVTALGEKERALFERSFDSRLQARIEALAQSAVPDPQAADRLRLDAERLRAEAQRLADQGKLTAGEQERLRQEARALAERARPDERKLAELREQVRVLAEQARPSSAELEAIRTRRREAIAALREHLRAVRQ